MGKRITVRTGGLLIIIFYLLFSPIATQTADAQFLKKLFKKKAKTEKKASTTADGIDDDAQVAMADITT